MSSASRGRQSRGSCSTVAAASTLPWLCPDTITPPPSAVSVRIRRINSGTTRSE
ncbi:hypothetical protein ACIBBG_08550 [Micromonospora chersina]|uniref:hypothetical protein n=1 Tax=Micromonospora chersina TaxID=47854 RepID=UPI0037A6D52F